MRKISDESKRKQKRGTGTLNNYKPWIEVGEFGSIGTACVVVDYITGRSVHLMSYAERLVWQMLRFDDDVVDVREQYPLDLEITSQIADQLGITHPRDTKTKENRIMTTDFLVTYTDGKNIAYSVKVNKDRIKNNVRTMEKLLIEKRYWEDYMNTKFELVTTDDINKVFSENIRNICHFYDRKYVLDDNITILKHLLANKIIRLDLNKELDYKELVKKYTKEIKEWKKQNYVQQTSLELVTTDIEY